MLELMTHGHDDAAAMPHVYRRLHPPTLILLQKWEVDVRVDYAVGCATAKIALQRWTGRIGVAAAWPRHRRGMSRDRAARRFRSASTAPPGALPPRCPAAARRGVSQAGRRVGCVGRAELRWPGGVAMRWGAWIVVDATARMERQRARPGETGD
jgi:hypothetical protein